MWQTGPEHMKLMSWLMKTNILSSWPILINKPFLFCVGIIIRGRMGAMGPTTHVLSVSVHVLFPCHPTLVSTDWAKIDTSEFVVIFFSVNLMYFQIIYCHVSDKMLIRIKKVGDYKVVRSHPFPSLIYICFYWNIHCISKSCSIYMV